MTEEIKTEPEVAPIISSITESVITPRLWANKFKSVEELEKAYGNAVTAMVDRNELQKKLDTITKVPDDYNIPDDIVLRETEINEIKEIAKNAGLTQEQFERTSKQMQSKIQKQLETFESLKNAIPDEEKNVLSGYVKKYYPEKVQDLILNQLYKDTEARRQAMTHRDQLLNSTVPGLNEGKTSSAQKYDGEKEMMDLGKYVSANPRDLKARERYINMANEIGEARYKK